MAYQDPRLSSDSQDYTTADALVRMARNRTYDESLFGQATNWLQAQKKKFAPTPIPDDAKGKSVSEDGGTVREQSWWGVPKTVPLDAPYYLPRELVGDWAYRNQGNILHGAIAAASLSPWGAGTRLAIAAPNIGYMLYSKLSGRQEPGWGEQSAPVQGHIPQPLSKPIAGDNHNELMRLLQQYGVMP